MQAIDLSNIKSQVATLEVAEGFFDSVILFALFDLGIFCALANGPNTLDGLHQQLDGNRDTLQATLDAAVAVKILSRENEQYRAVNHFLDCLGRPESPAYLGEWVAFLHALATPLMKLGDATRTGEVPGPSVPTYMRHFAP